MLKYFKITIGILLTLSASRFLPHPQLHKFNCFKFLYPSCFGINLYFSSSFVLFSYRLVFGNSSGSIFYLGKHNINRHIIEIFY